jgi:hypothetical protein
MSTVTGSVKSAIAFSQQPVGLPGTVTAPQSVQNFNTAFTIAGSAADQVNKLYINTLTFVASTPQTLDLTSLTDIYGAAVSFSTVRAITMKMNSTANGATLMLGYNASQPATAWAGFLNATGSLTVQASTATNSADLILTAPNTTGMAVSGGSKNLQLTPSAHAFTVDITIAGS